MKETLERLWNEYFAEECAVMNTKEERVFVKKAVEMHKTANELLTEEQSEAIEKYIEALYEIQGFLSKKHFLRDMNLLNLSSLKQEISGRDSFLLS